MTEEIRQMRLEADTQLAKLQGEVTRLMNEKEKERHLKKLVEAACKDAEGDLEGYKRRLAQANEEIADLTDRKHQGEETKGRLTAAKTRNKELEKELDKVTSRLNEEKARSRALVQEIEQVKSKLQQSEHELQIKIEQLNKYARDLKESEERVDRFRADLQKKQREDVQRREEEQKRKQLREEERERRQEEMGRTTKTPRRGREGKNKD